MIVYVESNFLLELAYMQEEFESCEGRLDLVEQERIILRLPSFCVAEARMSLARRTRERSRFQTELERQIREIFRSRPYSDMQDRSFALLSALIDSGEKERQRLDGTLDRVMRSGQVLPTTGGCALLRLHGRDSIRAVDAGLDRVRIRGRRFRTGARGDPVLSEPELQGLRRSRAVQSLRAAGASS